MIIKDDKVVEPVEEQVGENPPPYSPPQVRIAVVDQAQVLPDAPNITFRARGSSLGSLAHPSPPATASTSSTYTGYSGPTIHPAEHYQILPPPQDVPRTGFVHVQRENKPISRRIVVDPYLPFPPDAISGEGDYDDPDEGFGPRFPSPVLGDPERRNVRLECKNANVSTEIWVIGGNVNDISERRKAGIDIRAKNGFICAKIHASTSSPSFVLRITCKNGSVRIILPRSFSGPLTTRVQNGWVSLSPALANNTTCFSEMRGTRKSFVGDFLESGYGKGEWYGSSADITCENGRIKLCYLDEDTEKSGGGFFGRVFS